ncbi:hypothetical protein CERZMDRAFT_114945 [Cercospora zeae-maydis SCOH1-5]|uniref:Macro domain-containing protein n=1 Tax=Cercospora zeae-maydis SCOH1-5 TaxID=717836 RepID=A0A6A6F5C8_9PEZI|nr:hypothetical protein CERZMDRAFT_114945 [Cercospora zeae-maydis SCOH1-5]
MASSTIPLNEIPTLSLLYKLNKLAPATEISSHATSKFNDKISLIQTDITKLAVTAIVNAANESLLGGGGVDGAIHRAAGRELVEECSTLDGCDTGSAKITNAYGRLPCKKVIHAVGPIYKRRGVSVEDGGNGNNEKLLRGCYKTSMDLAAKHGLSSVAFSAISTGVYGYPSREAADVALRTVKGWLETNEYAPKIERVVFCQFLDKDQDAYEELVPKYFTPAASVDSETTDSTEAGEKGSTDEDARKESNLPELPEVPTKEPAQPDEPETKRQKLDENAKV